MIVSESYISEPISEANQVTVIAIAVSTGIIALLFAILIARRVLQEDQGTEAMKEIGKAIQEGASAAWCPDRRRSCHADRGGTHGRQELRRNQPR